MNIIKSFAAGAVVGWAGSIGSHALTGYESDPIPWLGIAISTLVCGLVGVMIIQDQEPEA